MKKKSNEPVSVRVGHFEFLKLTPGKHEWRDVYHWILSLSWPRFAALMAGLYLGRLHETEPEFVRLDSTSSRTGEMSPRPPPPLL